MLQKYKVLIIEDEAIWQDTLQDTLKGLECETQVINNSEDAVKALKRELFHFAIVDLQLLYEAFRPISQFGGIDILEKISSFGLNRTMGIMVVTWHDQEDVRERLQKGPSPLFFISKKAFDRDQVREKIQLYLENYTTVFYQEIVGKDFDFSNLASEAKRFEFAARTVKGIQQYFKEKDKKREKTVILFADLADSTLYKDAMDFFMGLYKTYEHNRTISEIIQGFRGHVVKYIGDAVMVRFDTTNKETRNASTDAINAAVKIQEAFRDKNYGIINELHQYRTRIGISIGVTADLEANNDAYGLCVDIAARLQSLSKPEQILVSHSLIGSADLDALDFKMNSFLNKKPVELISGKKKIKLKGVQEPQDVCEVMWDGKRRGIATS